MLDLKWFIVLTLLFQKECFWDRSYYIVQADLALVVSKWPYSLGLWIAGTYRHMPPCSTDLLSVIDGCQFLLFWACMKTETLCCGLWDVFLAMIFLEFWCAKYIHVQLNCSCPCSKGHRSFWGLQLNSSALCTNGFFLEMFLTLASIDNKVIFCVILFPYLKIHLFVNFVPFCNSQCRKRSSVCF